MVFDLYRRIGSDLFGPSRLDETLFSGYLYTSMITGVMTANLSLIGITSLKGKRSIVKSLIGRLRSRFNISISEVDHQDNKNIAVIGISIVSNDSAFIDRQFDSILDFMRKDGRFFLGQVERETFGI